MNSDYVDMKPFSAENTYIEGSDGTVRYHRWLGINWVPWDNLPGQNTATAKSFLFCQSSVGHVSDGVQTFVGKNERDAEDWVRHSCKIGTGLVEEANVVVLTHDDTAI
jgi:hypothetical protein